MLAAILIARLFAFPIVCNDACFETSEGAIVREDGSMTIDWVRHGENVDPIWHVGLNTRQPNDGVLAAIGLACETTDVTMTFLDAFANSNSSLNIPAAEQHPLLTGGGTVVKSTSAHAAIVHSIQTVLCNMRRNAGSC
jgi:hypothetical protein